MPYDLCTGSRLSDAQPGSRAELSLVMDRWGGKLVAFDPQPITSITIDAPDRAEALKPLRVVIHVTGPQGPLAGVVPVRVTLTSPSGRISPLSGVIGTASGRVNFAWEPAVNDERGRWTLMVAELASNQSSSRPILYDPTPPSHDGSRSAPYPGD